MVESAPDASAPEISSPASWRRWAVPLVSIVVVAAVAILLHRTLAQYHLADVLAHLREIPQSSLAKALGLTALSYCVLTLYDALAVRYVAKPVPLARSTLASFIAYAFGHNISLASFTGATIRYRLYSAVGLGAVDVATIVAFCSVTSTLGIALLAGISLLARPTSATAILHLHLNWTLALGAGLLSAVITYLVWASLSRQRFVFRNWSFGPPGPFIAIPQVLLAVTDLGVAASVLWMLLPEDANVDFVSFAGLYALAVIAGAVSNVPGGLGVFESVLILALPRVPSDQLLGSLLAYRAIYYLVPLGAASVLLGASELRAQSHRLSKIGELAGFYLAPVAPRLIGSLVFIAGAVLLVSGATPALDSRIEELRRLMPLPILELSHLAGSVIGLGLLVLARALFRRMNAGYHLTVWLLLGGIAASILKGLDFEEAVFLAFTLAILWLARDAFYRPAALIAQRLTPEWIASILIVVGVSVWIGYLANRHVEYQHDLWWTFALSADAPRVLRASFVIVLAAGTLVAGSLLRPAPLEPHDPATVDLERARVAIARSDATMSNLALAGDKRLLFHPDGDAFLMYQVAGRSWIALGDPVGPPSRHEDLVWSFRELAHRHAGWCVFYQVTSSSLPLYVDLGLSLLKLGEEARVPLRDFALEGSARAHLRQEHRRAGRAGATFEVIAPEDLPRYLPRLRRISDAWLQEKATAEKGFSVGSFDEAYLANFPVAIVRCEGDVVAFANIWTTATREELSIDLMRFGPDAPRGAMDFLFVELMSWGRQNGYRWFNLGMAPLSGLAPRPLAPVWHRLGAFLFRYGEHFYNFEGLRRYKQKFDPVWEPRYLASPGGLALPRILLDVSTLISGGLKELVTR